MEHSKLQLKDTLVLCFMTFIITCIVIFGIQFYRAVNIKTPDPIPIDDTLKVGIVSADNELIFTKEHQKEVEKIVEYIPIQMYKKVRSLPPDDLAIRALDRARKFGATIGTNHTATSSGYSTDDPRSGPPSGGILP